MPVIDLVARCERLERPRIELRDMIADRPTHMSRRSGYRNIVLHHLQTSFALDEIIALGITLCL